MVEDFEIVAVAKDGRRVEVSVTAAPIRDDGGRVVGSSKVIRDISARKRAEAAVRCRDRAIQAVAHGITITDPTLPDNPIVYASPGFTRVTGYPADEVLGRNCRFLQGKDTDPAAVVRVREAIRDGRPATIELLNYRRDGEPFWNEMTVSPVHDDDGRVTNYVGVQIDVSERRRLEDQYRHAQKMEAVGQLAGGVAHDFNNLLTIINMNADLLLATLPDGDDRREGLEEIRRAGERSAGLTRQLLAFSRKQVVAPRVFDLVALVADAGRMLSRLLGPAVELATPPAAGPVWVRADPGQVEQVVMNLAVNARDAMPDGGRLTVTTAADGRWAVLTVADTGVGMTAEVRDRVFEPFFTTKAVGKGTGLGLAVVHGVVEQSGGRVTVDTAPGAGTTFRVRLPLADPPGLGAKAASGFRAAPRGTETVLLVDDEAAVRSLTGQVLRRYGYTVLEAADAAGATTLAECHPGRLDLLVTDVMMPGGDGRRLADQLRRRRPGLRVLFVSGSPDAMVVPHGGGADILPKPYSPIALAEKVRDVLDAPS